MRSCEHFLVDSELERARHKVFNYAIENLDVKILIEKPNQFFNNLNCAAKVNLAFGFIFRNVKEGEFRYFYAHEHNFLLDRRKHVCTRDNLAKLNTFFNKTDVRESCSRERMDTTWKFYKFTKLTVSAAFFKDLPISRKDAVLHEPLSKNHTVNCLTYGENTSDPYREQLVPFSCSCSPFPWKSTTGKRNI